MSLEKLSKTSQQIALVDCNNFYASCERIFKPKWAKRPLGILSNNDGCIVARSNELKEAGIPMGAPYFQIRDQLDEMKAVIVSSNYTLYGNMSARVMNTLGQFTPEIEVYSIDEAWLDLSGFCHLSLDAYAREIAATTLRHTGIPVSVGIGPTRVLAKIANRVCKKRKIPGRVFNLGSAESLDHVLETIEVQDIWGIGRRLSKKLRASGIHTAKNLRDADPDSMRRQYSVVMQRIIMELRGVPCIGVEEIQPKKQIISSRSFGERVVELEPLLQSVAMHSTKAAEKLRSQNSVCGAIQVSIRTGRHNPDEEYYSQSALAKFAMPTADTRKLINAAGQVLRRIYRKGPRYAKAGVMLLNISQDNAMQGHLFQERDSEKAIALMNTVDQLNRLYGRRAVFFASEGCTQQWAMRRQQCTPAYTTRWDDLPVVR
ncbi:DNA polymerase IV 1 [Acaryochloris thomasi RCC1774]|uniref:DNA polymerase IV 1 n=1 Tax=Acaryochloris thomasi RCC1774 TaxID=1764569 RepID=A0A2W1J7W8_9CYAN|nr:Y-family DNA polymerase [Acaryochloris thomasi]PZD70543.1 DNA polymerase IV 1 [Acaryochloris thomasi RCC1774]